MKRYLLSGGLVGAGLIMSGCIILDGAPPVRDVPPYASFWEKPGVSKEQKQVDWVACGGSERGSFSPQLERGDTKAMLGEYSEKNRMFQHCLMGKGYRFTGQCTPDMPKNEPACGAP